MKRRLQAIITAGGGGVLNGVSVVPAFTTYGKTIAAHSLVFFESPATGSTMCMQTRGLTADGVRKHIKESNEKFGIFEKEKKA
jgi:hypothetical protein